MRAVSRVLSSVTCLLLVSAITAQGEPSGGGSGSGSVTVGKPEGGNSILPLPNEGPTSPKPTHPVTLKPGQSITDASGRVISNSSSASGDLIVNVENGSTLTQDPNQPPGNFVCSGNAPSWTIPAYNGTTGPVSVSTPIGMTTNGVVYGSGGVGSGALFVNVGGGGTNAVQVGGNQGTSNQTSFVVVTVSAGTTNSLTFGSRASYCRGQGMPGTGGTVHMGPSSTNTWSGPSGWNVGK